MIDFALYYVVLNCGAGDVDVQFCESEELANWINDHEDEGFRDDSVGKIEFQSEFDIFDINAAIMRKESYLIKMYTESLYEAETNKDFVKTFFPDGIPKFRVETRDYMKGYKYNYVAIGEDFEHQVIGKFDTLEENAGQAFEDLINGIEEAFVTGVDPYLEELILKDK